MRHSIPNPNAAPSPAPSAIAGGGNPQDLALCLKLIDQLGALRQGMLGREQAMAQELEKVRPEYRDSARNLIHYLTLRQVDLRPQQEQLAWLGLSSLGRSESHVIANLDKVLGLLHRLTNQPWQDKSAEEPAGSVSSRELLKKHTFSLLGPAPAKRPVRIMVTLPTEAATDLNMVRDLVDAGMDIARINCAHDSATDWQRMATNVRRAARAAQRPVKLLMDLGGPKIRTGQLAVRPPVLKLKPGKDELGRVYRPARLHLRPINSAELMPQTDASIGVWDVWLARLKLGTSINFSDARGAKRHLLVIQIDEKGAIAESLQTAYLTPETTLTIGGTGGKKKHSTLVCQINSQPGTLLLRVGDSLRLTKEETGPTEEFEDDSAEPRSEMAQVAVTLPQVIDQVKVGEHIWFDDGRIGGVIRHKADAWIDIEITQARPEGEKLGGDKGINLPDSQLNLPALSDKDIEDLTTVAAEADMVGLSFVQKPADIALLREHLQRLGRQDMGIVLKIETLQGFENLPDLMLSAMASRLAGVMIARGDLAVECGYERLADVQEEILWCAQAAHMPVIWATQVLEFMARTGLPSRAEISDAGLGVRAECVMLNKGPYITQAIRTLDDILKRMLGHQAKKRPLLRALKAWDSAGNMASDAMLTALKTLNDDHAKLNASGSC
ncbi:pyruvate kinase [Rhodoferax sp.]|uniref:pyruvate kinase n=1 Tax=Rhodoferax sp. TaxID=50421 RepID=UPI0026000BF4|nr:pyruvate kinase [Rhodoferax sp.]MCM2342581.1 pyruvate kinase [Rhodoferax sp.]